MIVDGAHCKRVWTVHCAEFDEERTERVIKRSVQKVGYMHLKPERLNVII